MTSAEVADRLAEVRERIAGAGGSPEGVTVVAVTKGFGPEVVEAAVGAGLADMGESYAQELEDKAARLTGTPVVDGCRWHYLGRVQRNKVRRLGPFVHMWQAVDLRAAGEEIARRAGERRVLVQVNVSGEEGKHGCRFDEAPALVDTLAGLGIDVRGLMAVGPAGPPEQARDGFRRLARLADQLGLPERSMGMTDDLEVAVQEGTTMVRVGRALFGTR
ncbi:MAG: YggS family pyridoxal phosphate-dependent enzyme [Acidimicrobiales bacterium]